MFVCFFLLEKKERAPSYLLDNDANTKTCMNQKCNEYKIFRYIKNSSSTKKSI